MVTVSEAMQLSKKGLKVELVGSSSQATGGALRCQASAGGLELEFGVIIIPVVSSNKNCTFSKNCFCKLCSPISPHVLVSRLTFGSCGPSSERKVYL